MQPKPSGDFTHAASSDSELCLALRAGESEALGILYDRHAGLVYSLARRLLGNSQEAEDLTQDIFLILARTTSYDPRRGSVRTYLAVLTRSRALDRLRSRRSAQTRLQTLQNSDLTSNSPAPLEQAVQQEESEGVQSALTQLPENQQQILRMAYYDGLSQAKIAERLDLPLGTVKARARRALLKLRQTLATPSDP
jgi:RNA polymerase sigma-70 factor, ECF subfamily